MDDLDKYYELDNIMSSLDILIRETNDQEWREEFQALRDQAQKEFDEVHKRVSKSAQKELIQADRDYIEGRLER